jgi:hypothetical protein
MLVGRRAAAAALCWRRVRDRCCRGPAPPWPAFGPADAAAGGLLPPHAGGGGAWGCAVVAARRPLSVLWRQVRRRGQRASC